MFMYRVDWLDHYWVFRFSAFKTPISVNNFVQNSSSSTTCLTVDEAFSFIAFRYMQSISIYKMIKYIQIDTVTCHDLMILSAFCLLHTDPE